MGERPVEEEDKMTDKFVYMHKMNRIDKIPKDFPEGTVGLSITATTLIVCERIIADPPDFESGETPEEYLLRVHTTSEEEMKVIQDRHSF